MSSLVEATRAPETQPPKTARRAAMGCLQVTFAFRETPDTERLRARWAALPERPAFRIDYGPVEAETRRDRDAAQVSGEAGPRLSLTTYPVDKGGWHLLATARFGVLASGELAAVLCQLLDYPGADAPQPVTVDESAPDERSAAAPSLPRGDWSQERSGPVAAQSRAHITAFPAVPFDRAAAALWALALRVYSFQDEVSFLRMASPERAAHASTYVAASVDVCEKDSITDLSDRIRHFDATETAELPPTLLVTCDFAAVADAVSIEDLRIVHGERPVTVAATRCGNIRVAVRSATGHDVGTVQRVADHLSGLLARNADLWKDPIRDVDIRTPEEREAIAAMTEPETKIEAHAFAPFHEAVQEVAQVTPDRIAVTHGDAQWSYREITRTAAALGQDLQDAGVAKGAICAVALTRGPALAVAMLALSRIGAVYLPLDPCHPEARNRSVLSDAAPKVALVDAACSQDFRRLLSDLGLIAQDVSLAALAARDARPKPVEIAPLDPAQIFYTSGSAGRPKGALIPHAGLKNHLEAKIELCGLGPKDRVAQTAAQTFDISTWQFLAPLVTGGRTVVYDHKLVIDPDLFLERLAQDRVTVLETVPTLLAEYTASLMVTPSLEPPHLRWLISNAETLEPGLAQRTLEGFSGAALVNTYGATECSDDTSHFVLPRELPRGLESVPVGRPIRNFTSLVLQGSRPAPIGCPGEIVPSGFGVGLGYLNLPEKSAKAFIIDPEAGTRRYRTGDIGYLSADGTLCFVGRMDSQVKINGHRIEIGEIDAALSRINGLKQARTVVREDDGRTELVAYFTAKRPAEADAVRAALSKRLPAYMVPAHIIQLDEIPLTPNGKLDRKRLPHPSEVTAPARPGDAFGTETERRVAEVWAKVLGTAPKDPEQDFFQAGGNSLKTVQLSHALGAAFETAVTVREVYTGRTIRAQAQLIVEKTGTQETEAPPESAPVAEDAPQSEQQQSLWVVEQLRPDLNAYGMASAYALRGALDRVRIEDAVQRLLTQQAALRTRFTQADDAPIQRIHPPAEAFTRAFRCADWTGCEEAEVQARLEAEAAEPFDLETGPIFRALLVKTGADAHVLLLALHHIVADAHSWAVLEETLLQLLNGETPTGPARSYADYCREQTAWLGTEDARRQIDGLKQGLTGTTAHFPIPAAPIGDAGPIQRREEIEVAIPETLLKTAKALGASEGLTPFIVWSALTAKAVHAICGIEDFVIGTPVDGRHDLRDRDTVGFFVNTLPLHFQITAETSLSALCAQAQEATLTLLDAQRVPMMRLAETLGAPGDAKTGLYTVVFALEMPEPDLACPGDLALERRELGRSASGAKFPLGITVSPERGAIRFDISTEEVSKRQAEAWMRIALDAMLAHCDLATVPREAPALQGAPEPLPPLTEALDGWAATLPEAAAVATPDGAFTRYADLAHTSRRIAAGLSAAGVAPGKRVAICLDRRPALITAMFGIWRCGASYVPINPGEPRGRLQKILEAAKPEIVLTDAPLDAIDLPQVSPAEAAAATGPVPSYPEEGEAYLFFTSGSTGVPKGVPVSHRNLRAMLAAFAASWGIDDDARMLALSPVGFDISLAELVLPLACGARVCLAPKDWFLAPEVLLRFAADERITHIQTTPSSYSALLDAGFTGDPEGLTIICGGEALSDRLAARLLPLGKTLMNAYGPTECTIWTTEHRVSADQLGRAPVTPIGRPYLGTEVLILDAQNRPLPDGLPGELAIAGPGVAEGYLDAPELTARRFIDHPQAPGCKLYRTGDQAVRVSGELHYLGRFDRQVKLSGLRFDLSEVETLACAVGGVKEARSFLLDPSARMPQVAVAVVSEAAAPSDLRADLAARFRSHLPSAVEPQMVLMVEAFPLTDSGKVDVTALRRAAQDAADAVPRAIPEGPEAETVRHCFAEVLDLPEARIGIEDSFFDLGGRSLSAVHLASKLTAALGRDIRPFDIYRLATPAALAVPARQAASAVANGVGVTSLNLARERRPRLALVHGQGGDNAAFLPLARALDGAVEVFCFEVTAADPAARFATLDALAEGYCNALPDAGGVLWLGGWSFGGTLAHLMARRRERAGRPVAGLLLLDSLPFSCDPEHGQRQSLQDLARWFGQVRLGLAPQALQQIGAADTISDLGRVAAECGKLPAGVSAEVLGAQVGALHWHGRLAAAHADDPKPARTPGLVVRATRAPATEPDRLAVSASDWTPYFARPPKDIALDADHFGLLEDGALAAALRIHIGARADHRPED